MSDFKLVKLIDPPVHVKMAIVPKGAWVSTEIYCIGDLVSYHGLSYIAIKHSINVLPTDVHYWQVVVDINLGSNEWLLTGNTGINPALNFLGTLDAQPLKFRTNDNPIAQFDVNGNLALGSHDPKAPLHIKSYPGYTDSGLRMDTFSLTTNATGFTSAYAVNMVNNQVVRVKFQVTSRQSDGAERASFTRSALFYKQGGNVMIQGSSWQSDFTTKSSNFFDVSYSLGTSTIIFNVKPVSSIDTYWVGNVELEFLSDSL